MISKVLGIIPARGGSKGVTRKNIRLLCNRPLIAFTIDAARQSRLLTDVVISTDDPEIEAVSSDLGCRVVRRPQNLALDTTPMMPVIRHALRALEKERGRYDFVVALQPTCPMRQAEDIDHALELLSRSGADSVISVYQVADHHPGRMYKMTGARLVPYDRKWLTASRQQLPPVFHRNGAIYAARRQVVITQSSFMVARCVGYVMPRERSVNIDEEIDLAWAEFLMNQKIHA